MVYCWVFIFYGSFDYISNADISGFIRSESNMATDSEVSHVLGASASLIFLVVTALFSLIRKK